MSQIRKSLKPNVSFGWISVQKNVDSDYDIFHRVKNQRYIHIRHLDLLKHPKKLASNRLTYSKFISKYFWVDFQVFEYVMYLRNVKRLNITWTFLFKLLQNCQSKKEVKRSILFWNASKCDSVLFLMGSYSSSWKDVYLQKCQRVQGSKNPAYQHGGRLSPFSDQFIHYQNNTAKYTKDDVKKKRAISIKEHPENQSTKLEYWLNKGYNQKEAQKLLSERQRTFTLDKCIERYGQKEGTQIWHNRQNRWQTTLNNKSNEEKAEINRKKISKSGNISKGELKLKKLLEENLNQDLGSQLIIKRNDDSNSFFKYDIYLNNKIIEYNGDLWHANPNMYKSDDIPPFPGNQKTAQEIWSKDLYKRKVAKNNNYEVLTIWESDFKNEPTKVIQTCKNFLRM